MRMLGEELLEEVGADSRNVVVRAGAVAVVAIEFHVLEFPRDLQSGGGRCGAAVAEERVTSVLDPVFGKLI